MQTAAETSIPSPKCATCDARMQLSVLVPRDDGGGEWRFSCPVCKTSSVVITNP
jgi:transposase-like protein